MALAKWIAASGDENEMAIVIALREFKDLGCSVTPYYVRKIWRERP